MRVNKPHKPTKSEKRRLNKGQKSFYELWEEVAPFVKKRKFKEHSTTGKWEIPTYAQEI